MGLVCKEIFEMFCSKSYVCIMFFASKHSLTIHYCLLLFSSISLPIVLIREKYIIICVLVKLCSTVQNSIFPQLSRIIILVPQ